jgi:GTP-binding protein
VIVGENARPEDLDVNALKEQQSALEFLRDDEYVEVMPESVRLRKVELDKLRRQKAARQNPAAPHIA